MLARLAIPGILSASQSVADDPLAANAHLVLAEAGNMMIDPLPLDEQTHEEIERRGGVSLVVVLSPQRAPHAAAFTELYGATIVDRAQHRQALLGSAFAIGLPNQREEGAFAVVIADRATVVVGETLLGTPAGALSLPAIEEGGLRAAALGLRAILRENPQRLLVGRGQSIFAGAYPTLYRLLYEAGGAGVHRVNLDELDFHERHDRPAPYLYLDAEVGFEIGARLLGYRVSTLLPGQRFCPLHGHAREEELFVVLEGAPSVRMLNGTIQCRKGDFIALPVGETGTHQLLNESDAPATVLLLGRTEEVESCYYPDSDKLLIDTPLPFINGDSSRLVRAAPDLDYFDGETLST